MKTKKQPNRHGQKMKEELEKYKKLADSFPCYLCNKTPSVAVGYFRPGDMAGIVPYCTDKNLVFFYHLCAECYPKTADEGVAVGVLVENKWILVNGGTVWSVSEDV